MAVDKKILVIGDPEAAAPLLQDSNLSSDQITFCKGDKQAIASLKRAGLHFEWIVISSAALGQEQMDLNQYHAAIGTAYPQVAPRECGVEWRPDGSLQLHCSSLKACLCPTGKEGIDSVLQEQGFVFEYQAPVNKAG